MLIVPLPQGFGVEVTDLAAEPGQADVAALREAYDRHHLLIFRGLDPLPPERQAEIAGWFGPIGANRGADGKPWTVLRNDEPSGSKVLPFHSDITFFEYPLEGISLHPVALPREDTTTSFISNAVAWRLLPEPLRARVEGRRARHYFSDAITLDVDWPPLEHWHPIRMVHPRTGIPLLFVTEHHVDAVEGLDAAEAAALLPLLFDTLYAAERCYEHVWQPGDLLVWDNLAIQHARRRESTPADGARVMRRVAMGEHNFADQLAKARALAA